MKIHEEKYVNNLISLVADAIRTNTEEEAIDYLDSHFTRNAVIDHVIAVLLS